MGDLRALQNAEQLRFMDIPMGESKWATETLLLSWHLLMRRAWSFSQRSAPPESQAELLGASEEVRARAASELEVQHKNMLLLERRATELDEAAFLRRGIIFLDSHAVRLVFEFFCRDKHKAAS